MRCLWINTFRRRDRKPFSPRAGAEVMFNNSERQREVAVSCALPWGSWSDDCSSCAIAISSAEGYFITPVRAAKVTGISTQPAN
jgi:hypothetical protein